MRPKLIGLIAALSNSRRTASVSTDTQVMFETISIDQIKNALKKDVDTAIKAITMRDEIKRLQSKIAQLSLPEQLDVPDDVTPEVKEVLSELKEIYESSN